MKTPFAHICPLPSKKTLPKLMEKLAIFGPVKSMKQSSNQIKVEFKDVSSYRLIQALDTFYISDEKVNLKVSDYSPQDYNMNIHNLISRNFLREFREEENSSEGNRKWLKEYTAFSLKWNKNNPKMGEQRVEKRLPGFESVLKLDWNWLEPFLKKDFKEIETEESDSERFEKWRKEENLELVTLTESEQLEYAQMVRQVEDMAGMEWQEVQQNTAKWDKKWPRYILPDGTPLPHLRSSQGLEEFKNRVQNYEEMKLKECGENRALAFVLKNKAEKILKDLLFVQIFLSKNGLFTQDTKCFSPSLVSFHSFLSSMDADAIQITKENAFQGAASAFLSSCLRFIDSALKLLEFDGDKIQKNECIKLKYVLKQARDILKDITVQCKRQIAKSNNNLPPVFVRDPRMDQEKYPHTSHRTWAIITKRQQDLFDSIRENRKAIQSKIVQQFQGSWIDTNNDRLKFPVGEISTGDPVVDAHFKKLVEAINSSGGLSGEEKIKFFTKIPSTIGGIGKPLKVVESVKEID